MAEQKKTKRQSAKALAIAASPKERASKIEELIKVSINQFGKGSLGTLRGKHAIKDTAVGYISSGSLGIDQTLGGFGFPRGRICEIYGPNGTGKTTLALHGVAECQRLGGIAAFVDAEHTLNPSYADALGCNLDELLINQPDSGEQALNVVYTLVSSGKLDLIVVDSVAALVPQAELEVEIGESRPGAQARMMSQAMRKMASVVAGTNTCVIFINQTRFKINTGGYGNPETTSGGEALKFYASVRMDVRRIGPAKRGEKEIGNRLRVKVVKNKLAPPFQKCEIDLIWGQGVAIGAELLDFAVGLGIVEKKGSWYSFSKDYGSERLGQGRSTVVQHLMERSEIVDEIRSRAYAT
jgi:recombination protein RecA